MTIFHPTALVDSDFEITDEKDNKKSDHETAPKRGRGRPPGSIGATKNNERLLSCDFYFFRACLEKIDVEDAADRYLPHLGIYDKRVAVSYERHLRKRIQIAINALDDRDHAQSQFDSLMAPDAPREESVFFGPSLEEFAARLDGDYSERELQELYVEEYGIQEKATSLPGKTSTLKQKNDALNWLLMRIAHFPNSDQPVKLWIDKTISEKVRPFGVLTLGNFIDWINIQGIRWFDKLDGMGERRALHILVFFVENEKYFDRHLSPRLRFYFDSKFEIDIDGVFRPRKTSLTVQGMGSQIVVSRPQSRSDGVQVFGIVPIESLNWPPALLGTDGVFRAAGPNTFDAQNDRMAIEAWFKTLDEKSPATKDSYRRAVERLVLWSVVERRCSLSSLNTLDFTAFRDFLRNPPPHWCSRFPVLRYSEDWRPLRGPMGDASIQATMSAVATLFADLLACGYLSANAVASVRTAKRTTMRMDVMRSFAEEDLVVIRDTLNQMKDSDSKRRLRAMLLLFQTSGMRRSEVANLTWGNLSPIRLSNKISDVWAATFIGKGNKERIVPLQASTIQALQDHYDDRMKLVASGLLPYFDIEKKDTPVLSILEYGLTKREAGKSDSPGDAVRTGNLTGGLSESRIYLILKSFFKAASSNLAKSDRVHGQADFLKASTHWLRHTFAHQALKATDRDLAAVQQILGHADIGTTGLYVKADMTSRVAAVDGVVGFDRQ